jgi:hypothetical protein
MRMLTNEERDWLSVEDFDGEECDDTSLAMADELERCGRAEWREHPYDDDMLHSYTTEMGHKALRIDALIRSWGVAT